MIPVSLKLKNFLSYGEDSPTLDFTSFQVACVTGRNGHGKSALFDAITWAIWGEARKASSDRKPDEGLLRIGATDLLVEFVFDLDGQRFRVRRSYRKTTKSGSSSLELQILDPTDNRFRTLSESSSIRKTQGRINNLMRVSYDTFINSAFILQGRVDAFTRRSASERKDILSEILELSRYDALGLRARDRAQRSETDGTRARDLMTQIEAASVQRQELQKQLVDATRALQETEQTSKSAENDLDKCNRALASAEAGQAQCTALKIEREGLLLQLEDARAELASAESMAALAEQALISKNRILSDVETLGHLRKEEVKLRDKQTKLQELEIDRTRLQADLEAARLKVVTRSDHWTAVVADLRKQIAECDAQLAKRSEIREALVELTELRKRDRALIALRSKRDEVEKSRRELERTFDRHRGEIQVDIETRQAKRRELLVLLDRKPELERSFNDARQHLDTFVALTEEMDRAKREGTETQQSEERLKERREGLGQRRQQLVTQISQLRDRESPDCPLCGSGLNDQHRKEVVDQLTEETEQLGWEFGTVGKGLLDTRTRRDACRVTYQKLRDQVHPMGDAPRLFAHAEAELAQVSSVYQDLEYLVGSIQELEDRAKNYETSSAVAIELKQLLQQIQELTAESDQHEGVRRRIESIAPAELENIRLDEIQQQLEKAKTRLPGAEEKQTTAGEWLEKKHYAQDIQESLEDVVAKLKAVGYDAAAHTALGGQIQQLSESENALANLQRSEQDLAVSQAKIEAVQNRISELTKTIGVTNTYLLNFKNIDKELVSVTEDRARLSAQLLSARASRDLALRAVAGLERDQEACLQLEAQREGTAKTLEKCQKDARIYRELVKAFGRDGIQALLIDQAIPELQDEANRILSRLTANRTQVSMASLGELKSGGTKETLDIRIGDEMGERRYELYSGGEAFRVDFAIRIALSKLLARRSGTPLQTLVIDEGFGTQDEEGLVHLVEAIQTISDEFEKILVITHVDAIKNAFPVRIEVVKEAESGSTFSIER
jgi:exonuclease SbcC